MQLPKPNSQLVSDFMESFGQLPNTLPKDKLLYLRSRLIQEEYYEFVDAKTDIDRLDALADLLYVVYGAAHALGYDIDGAFREVHRSNMSKLDSDGKPIYREDGKVMKGPNYTPPDLHPFV